MSTLASPPSSVSVRSPSGLVPQAVSPPILVAEPARLPPVALPVPTAARLRHDLFASVWDAGAYSVMVGIAESYFGAYALALGLGPAAAALMVTVPVLLGSILQLATPWGVRWLGSNKRWVVGGIMTQVACLTLLPLAALFVSTTAAMIAFAAVAFYWAAGLAGNPPWNTWMEEVVPIQVRTRFFACRQRTSQICLLIGFVLGGVALQYGRAGGMELAVFGAIFLIAATSRFISGCFVATQSEVSRGRIMEPPVSFRQLLSGKNEAARGSMVVYLLAMQVAVQISGPYFTPFMLKEEQWSYITYMSLLGVAFLGKALAAPLWGRVGQQIGATRLLWVGGLAIVPISSLWLASELFVGTHLSLGFTSIPGEIVCIGFVQLLSGMTWAAYELAMALLFLHGIPRRERVSMLTLYNFGNSAAMVVGGLIGGAVLRSLGESHNAYMTLFVMSSVARLCMVPLLLRVKEPATTSETNLVAKAATDPNVSSHPAETSTAL